MKNIIITGATSFMGENLIKFLCTDLTNNIYVVVRPDSKNINRIMRFNKRIHFITCDLKDTDKYIDQIKNIDSLYLIAWSGTRGKERNDEVLQKSSYIDNCHIIDKAITNNVKHIIGIGSQAEYGICNKEVTELSPINPSTEYGKYKNLLLRYIEEKSKDYGFDYKWARIFSAFGPDDYPSSIIMYSIKNMLINQPVQLSACTQIWNFTYISDIAKVLSMFNSNNIPSGVYQITSNDTRPLKDFIIEIKSILGFKGSLSFSNIASQINLIPNNNKLMSIIPNLSFTPFSIGIKNTVSQFH